MSILNKRVSTKEARKELADLFLKVAANKSIEKDQKVITWSNATKKFSIKRKIDFTVTDTDFLVCDWVMTSKYEISAKDALEQRGIVNFRNWFDSDFSTYLQAFPINTSTANRFYIHVNERYTRLTKLYSDFKGVQERNKSIFFGDNRDVLLRRELLGVGFNKASNSDCYVLSINESLIKMDTLNSIFAQLDDIKECNSFSSWKNCSTYETKEDQYNFEIKTLEKIESLSNKVIDHYFNLKGLLTYIEFLTKQVELAQV